jgi:hypothetical protein
VVLKLGGMGKRREETGVTSFYRGRGNIGEATMGDNGWLNGLQAINDLAWLMRGLTQGFKAGES